MKNENDLSVSCVYLKRKYKKSRLCSFAINLYYDALQVTIIFEESTKL